MSKHVLVREWRPSECSTRLGDIVLNDSSDLFLKIKCRRCTKKAGHDRFHMLPVNPAPDNHGLINDLIGLVDGLIDISSDPNLHKRFNEIKERFKR